MSMPDYIGTYEQSARYLLNEIERAGLRNPRVIYRLVQQLERLTYFAAKSDMIIDGQPVHGPMIFEIGEYPPITREDIERAQPPVVPPLVYAVGGMDEDEADRANGFVPDVEDEDEECDECPNHCDECGCMWESHYHCAHCGKVSGMMGHYIPASDSWACDTTGSTV